MEILGIENVLIGIEDNKPEAIKEMTRVAATDDRNVIKLKSRYPQGAEKMLIYATTGRKVPPGKLPADVGVIVMNVNSKRVTVDGPSVKRPGNVEVLIGTPISEVLDTDGWTNDGNSAVYAGYTGSQAYKCPSGF